MTERQLYQPLIKGARREGILLYRIADGSPGKKPFDIGGCGKDGVAIGLEVKLVCKISPLGNFPWNLFPEHQLNWLKAFSKMNARGIIAIYEAEPKLMKLYYPEPSQIGTAKTHEIKKSILMKSEDVFIGWEHE